MSVDIAKCPIEDKCSLLIATGLGLQHFFSLLPKPPDWSPRLTPYSHMFLMDSAHLSLTTPFSCLQPFNGFQLLDVQDQFSWFLLR
jgi:hypothetical protein